MFGELPDLTERRTAPTGTLRMSPPSREGSIFSGGAHFGKPLCILLASRPTYRYVS
jgi:hypothetical protein